MILNLFPIAILLWSVLCLQQASSATCPCEDPSTGATWGPIISVGPCTGTCDAASHDVIKACNRIQLPTPMQCFVKRNCVLPLSCEGEWGPWANAAQCSNSCGHGRQRQTRSCYKRGRPGFPNNHCPGGMGSKSQDQFKTCSSKQNCTNRMLVPSIVSTTPQITLPVETSNAILLTTATPTVSTVPTTTTATTATTVSITREVLATEDFTSVIASETLDLKEKVINNNNNDNNDNNPQIAGVDFRILGIVVGCVLFVCITIIIVVIYIYRSKLPRRRDPRPLPGRPLRPPPRRVNVTVIGAVIGSVAFVCIALVVVAILLIRRKHDTKKKQRVITSSNQCSGVYETVGPALPPPRSPSKKMSTLNKFHQIRETGMDQDYIVPETIPTIPRQTSKRNGSKPTLTMEAQVTDLPPEEALQGSVINETLTKSADDTESSTQRSADKKEENAYLVPLPREPGVLPTDENNYLVLDGGF